MSTRSTSGGRGTNQYVTRGASAPHGSRGVHARAAAAIEFLKDNIPAWQSTLDEGGPLTASGWASVGVYVMEQPSAAVRALQHPEVPAEIIGRLADHESTPVRVKAVRHPRCPTDVLACALDDPHIAGAAASNPRVPVESVQGRLRRCADPGNDFLGTGDQSFLIGVVENQALPVAVHLSALGCALAQPKATVRRAVLKAAVTSTSSPEVLSSAYGHIDKDNDLALAATNPSCPAPLLIGFASHRSSVVRAAVLVNPNCPPDALAHFSRSASDSIRSSVVRHPRMTADLLGRMLQRERDQGVLDMIVENPLCTDEMRAARAFLR